MPILNCMNMSLGYENETIVADLNFSINSGDYLCIIGENGSGKSTLIKTLLNLKRPIDGKILYDKHLKLSEVGYLPQQISVRKDFPVSVQEVVLSGCLNRCGFKPFYSQIEKEVAIKNMKRLNIYLLAKKCYRELSGGQQQRVRLARALCATRKLLLLDEPVSGLDSNSSSEMYRIIQKLNIEDKITIIMVSHDIEASLKYATHILHLHPTNSFFGTISDYSKTNFFADFKKIEKRSKND